ncbi:MAG: LPP20 family lipoprotein [Sulfurimonas sp.]|nr:LPP20 family lipoprotein [Sulfurimonas sp.]
MFKSILFIIIITAMTGCLRSVPKTPLPNWYTNMPKSNELYHAVGMANTIEKAKENAIISMRENLNLLVDSTFTSNKYHLKNLDKDLLEKILEYNKMVSEKISIKNITIVKSETINNNKVVLINIPKSELFLKLKFISSVELSRVKQEYQARRNPIALKRFIILDSLMQKYAKIASLAGYKKFLIPQYDEYDEFSFLNKMKAEYDNLRPFVSVCIVYDTNSKLFALTIKKLLMDKGINVVKDIKDRNSLKLFITSKSSSSKEQSLNKVKSHIKFAAFDGRKNQISFKEYTFIGKSKKDVQEAKQQIANNLKSKIEKLGISDFFSFEK